MNETKENILNEALTQFSVKGYDGVSMSDIAGAVGIKAASIYKHYSGKEDIFHQIVQRFEAITAQIFDPALLPSSEYVTISTQLLTQMIQQTFRTYAEDPFLSKCRRLFVISSFHRQEIGELYSNYFIKAPLQYQSALFTMILQEKGRNDIDSSIMAYHFYSPILILLQEYDYKMISIEEAFCKIEQVVAQFAKVY